MAANKIVVVLLLATALFAFAATGGSLAFIGWIGGFLLLATALFLGIHERKSQRQDDSYEDRA